MRLINTTTLELHEFSFDELGFKVPSGYAILSHRWRDDEVEFKDFTKKRRTSGSGYAKIVRCCEIAKSRGFDWVWIDTCCIDKRSSSELSEAINSMFRWYTSARECYAFLDDVELEKDNSELERFLRSSEWFTRGWTLQELIGPKVVIFVDAGWHVIGIKSRRAIKDLSQGSDRHQPYRAGGRWPSARWPPEMMLEALMAITGIPKDVLVDQRRQLRWQSVAERMSWMGGRRTARVEDCAYAMLGLFNISMAPLYGEGLKAFDRLQATILQTSSDETIFAWDLKDGDSWRMLAQWPAQFVKSEKIRPAMKVHRSPYSITNQGLRFEVRRGIGMQESKSANKRRFLAVHLNCATSEADHERLGTVYLEQAACGHFIRRPAGGGIHPKFMQVDDERDASPSPSEPQTEKTQKRPRGSVSGPDGFEGEEGLETIIIHMGQEHHTACRIFSDDAQLRVGTLEESIQESGNNGEPARKKRTARTGTGICAEAFHR